jgi:hypothetical protein
MVHRSIRNDSRMADELYTKRVLLVLEDFHFFSLYSFSCIAKQVATLKQLRLCLVLIPSTPTSSAPYWFGSYIHIINTTYARSHPLQIYTSSQ